MNVRGISKHYMQYALFMLVIHCVNVMQNVGSKIIEVQMRDYDVCATCYTLMIGEVGRIESVSVVLGLTDEASCSQEETNLVA